MQRTRRTCCPITVAIISCPITVAIAILLAQSGVLAADELKSIPRGPGPVDQPFGLVAFASLDRLLAQAASLADSIGEPGAGADVLDRLTDDKIISTLLTDGGLDSSRPIGALFYPHWFQGKNGQNGVDEETDEGWPDLFDFADSEPGPMMVVEFLAELATHDSTLVLHFPVKDRQRLLDSVCRVLVDEDEPVEDADHPGWYRLPDQDLRLGFSGNYLLLAIDTSSEHRYYLNYPEFDKIAKTSLGKNGFVYSLFRRGLPAIVRDSLIPALRMAYAARFQKFDDETETDFRLRTMLGAQQIELLDMLASQVEEFRIAGHVDDSTKTTVVETELVGPKDGKLARYFHSSPTRENPFGRLVADDARFSMLASYSLPPKVWKPIVDLLFAQAQRNKGSDAAEVLRVIARTIESGHFDFYTLNPTWETGMIAIRISGNDRFPERFQAFLESLPGDPFSVAADSIEGIPIHRSLTTGDIPCFAALEIAVQLAIGQLPMFPEMMKTNREVEIQYLRVREKRDSEGSVILAPETVTEIGQAADASLWLAATPQAIWLTYGPPAEETCPDWFKSQIAASLVKPTSAGGGRTKSPFQFVMRGLGAADVDQNTHSMIQLTNGIDQLGPDDQEMEVLGKADEDEDKARGRILRDLPNRIRGEVRPTETGIRWTLTFEEAYFHWFASFAKPPQKNQAVGPTPAPILDPVPAP